MKTFIFSMAASVLLLAACNTDKKSNPSASADSSSAITAEKADTPAGGASEIVGAYLELKNALAADDDQLAAQAGKSLEQKIASLDKASLSPEQSKVFTDIADDAKEHAEHIGANAGNIKHQREHFETLSQEIYELVKAGSVTGRTLYVDHCPMYNEGKGGNWISETKQIQNPYMGKSMPDCGSIKEELN